jgi:Zn finger protein HypA/HybF involved in hydrogenase expression
MECNQEINYTIRSFACQSCQARFDKYFAVFETSDVFATVECPLCSGAAQILSENDGHLFIAA